MMKYTLRKLNDMALTLWITITRLSQKNHQGDMNAVELVLTTYATASAGRSTCHNIKINIIKLQPYSPIETNKYPKLTTIRYPIFTIKYKS